MTRSAKLMWWYVLGIHLRGIATGEGWWDRAKIGALLAMRGLSPIWVLARWAGLNLPDPRRLIGWYRLCDEVGRWDVYGAGGAAWLALVSNGGAVARVLDQCEAGTLVDVGASYGYFTIRCAKALGSRGNVVAIEAHPEHFQELCRSVALNTLQNVMTFHCAAGDEEGVAMLYDPPFGSGGMDPSLAISQGRSIEVPLRTVDGICAELRLQDVSVVKIDVEGFEAAVLRGMSTLMGRDHPEVVFEALSDQALEDCTAILQPFGYAVRAIGEHNYVAL